MTAVIMRFIIATVILLCCTTAFAGSITDSRITAEVILDGMTHFDADQGLKDYKVDILEVIRETDRPEVIQREKLCYFMAPNIYLTMIGDRPETLQNDASFMLLLSNNDLVREPDVEVRDELCFKVIATPRDPAFKRYTETYYVSKADYRKIRTESVSSSMDHEFIRYQRDYYYEEYEDDGETWLLVARRDAIGCDNRGNLLMEHTSAYSNYEFDISLTRKFFEDIMKDYNPYYSEGT